MWKKIFGPLSLFLLVTTISSAATLTVDLNGGADYTDIQSAIDAAKDGDTVLVKPGEYVIMEPIDFNRLHNPDDPTSRPVKNIVLKSEGGAEVTTIRMSDTPVNPDRASVVIFEKGETVASALEGLKLAGGEGVLLPDNVGTNGGGVYCQNSSPMLTNCTLSGNLARYGGGVYCHNASPTLTSCTISGNSAYEGCGGVYCEDSSPTLTNCTISGNSSEWSIGYVYGGGVSGLWSSPTLTNCTISGNSAPGVNCWYSSPTLTSCIVWDNVGGALVIGGDSQPSVSFSCMETEALWPGEGNINADPLFCGWGDKSEVWVDPSMPGLGNGGLRSPYSDPRQATKDSFSLALSLESPCLRGGKGGANMGADTESCEGSRSATRIVHLAPGIYAAEDFDLAHKVSLLGSHGGATVLEGTVVGLRTGSLLSNLKVTKGARGGIVVDSGERPEITNCTISENWSRHRGGLCCDNGSSPTLTNCTISGNSSPDGGGVSCLGNSTPTLTNCTITGNVGGAVSCQDHSSPTLTNCTITENIGVPWWGLGGVYCSSASSPTLKNCTVWGNTPESICGNLSDCLTDREPLFIQPGRWEECDSGEGDGCVPYDWADTCSCGLIPQAWSRWIPGDYHLQPGSPCIDAGTSVGTPTTDIEGHDRPCGEGVDIGAYEFGDCSVPGTPFRRGDSNADSTTSLSDAITILGYLFLGSPMNDCKDAADVNDDGKVDMSDPVRLLGHLFLGSDPPPEPFGVCGVDPTEDDLDCNTFGKCP